MQGAGILSLSANDNITVQVINSSTISNTQLLEANRSAFQLMRMKDDWNYFRARSTDTTDVDGSTWHPVTWNTVDEEDSPYTHGSNNPNITLTQGFYLVTYNIKADNAGGGRKSITTKATLDGTDQPYGWGYSYIRGTDGCDTGVASSMFLIEVTDSAMDLQIEVSTILDELSTPTNLITGQSAISIVKLPSTAEVLMVYSNNDQAAETPAIIVNEVEDTEDPAFSHNTSTGIVTLNDSGNYLFGFTAGLEGVVGGDTVRGLFGSQWNINGSPQDYGVGGSFLRNDQASAGTYRGGHFSATLLSNVSASTTISINATLEGQDGGSQDTYEANQHGMWAIYFYAICGSSSSSSSSSTSSSSATPGTVVWGHHTGVSENYDENFTGNISGWSILGTPGTDNEAIDATACNQICTFEKWYLGTMTAIIKIDKYQTGSGPAPTIQYRTAASGAGITSATWFTYNGVSFTSLGWIQIRLIHI
jgi:hypothetical protein